ncbi:MAG TPA: M3 family oligoendopeptidase [Tissierellia bacterium]|nr:M3 family oligoendopeptidase [Tissierellia bacterium]
MKFSQMEYQRIDLPAVKERWSEILQAMAQAESFDEHYRLFLDAQALSDHSSTMATLASIRHSVDTLDPFYKAESDYMDEIMPQLQELANQLAEVLLATPFLPEYEDKLGEHFFNALRLQKKTFDPAIMPDLAEENKLSTQYDRLMGGAQVEFRGEVYTLAGLGIFLEDADRATRREAAEASWGFMQANQAELDEVYDKLVKVRHRMAKKLGYDNFVQMGYDRFGRTDYDHEDVARFREGIVRFVVPLAMKGFEEQRERLGLDELTYYDVPFRFLSGNPKPQGDKDFMIEQATRMYDELSPETSQFFRLLVENELLDLEQKPGKMPGGYCTFIDNYQMPFIFSNFNGTSGDVDVLTHEFGHAFQVYNSRHLIGEQRWPGMEAAEIHSMGMEYIAYPWMAYFFGDETDKYYYDHNVSNIAFLPYGALVDHFQHWVYENPEVTAEERRAKWRELEKTYNPWVDYQTNDYLNAGGRWQKQGHIYSSPFYYIDYCLAQICAMQIFKRSLEDRDELWQDYVEICRVGGSLPFTEILKVGHFKNPFDPAVVQEAIGAVKQYLGEVDTSRIS